MKPANMLLQAADVRHLCARCAMQSHLRRLQIAIASNTMPSFCPQYRHGCITLLLVIAVSAAQLHAVAGQLGLQWARPCKLVGTQYEAEVTGSNGACSKCSDGAMASNQTKKECTFKGVTIPHSSSIVFTYQSSPHHLYVGAKPCTYTTEVCSKNATTSTPCTYTFPTAGTFYVSDKTKHYCEDYSAHLQVVVT